MNNIADDLEKAYACGWNDSMNFVVEKLNKACDAYEMLIKVEQDEEIKAIYKKQII